MQTDGSVCSLLKVAAPPDWKHRVAHAFSRAACDYQRLAYAQQIMGERLWPRLPERPAGAPWRVLDLGCGPGHWCARLAEHYGPGGSVIGLDLAPGMLRVARQHYGDSIRWLCGDAAALPLGEASINLVISNLAIQWCPDLNAVFAELYRILRPGGRALINTLGPGTLEEVRHAWSHPNRPAALLPFQNSASHLAAARLAGFSQMNLSTSQQRFHYPNLAAVMASIKGIGAQTARSGAPLTRADLVRAKHRYENLREPAGLPVTYQLLTLTLER